MCQVYILIVTEAQWVKSFQSSSYILHLETIKHNTIQLYARLHISVHFYSMRFPSEGEEWQAVRSLLGKHMLRPKAVEAYDKTLNGVVSDLIAKLRLSRRPQGLVTDIASEFYRFGLEGKVPRSLRSAPHRINIGN